MPAMPAAKLRSSEKEVFLDLRDGRSNGSSSRGRSSPATPSGPPGPPARPGSPGVAVPFSTKLPEVLACCSALSFHFSLGLVLAFSAVLLPQLEAPDSDLKISKDQASLVASVVALSVPVGSLLTGPTMEALGRLRTVQLAALPFALGCALMALADGFPMLLAGRFLTGVAAGTFGTNPAIVYTTEVARPELRGALISVGPFMVSLGTMVTYILGAFLPWRTLSWVFVGGPVVTLLLVLLCSTESPLWLASVDRREAALDSLCFLSRRDPVKLSRAEEEVALLLRAAAERQAAQRRGLAAFLAALFLRRAGLRPLLILATLFALQQFAGIYVMLFFAVSFFKDVGSALDPNTASMLVGAIRVATSIQATFMLRRFGRRPLLMLSALLCALAMAVSGYFARLIATAPEGALAPLAPARAWQMRTFNESVVELSPGLVGGGGGGGAVDAVAPWVRWVPVVAILVFVYASMLGLLTIPWTMTAELFAPRVRSLGQGVSVALANVAMFGAVQSYKDLVALLGGVWAVQWLYAAVALAAVVFAYLFVPETHRRTLPEIEEYFDTSLVYPLYQRRQRRQRRTGLVVNSAEGGGGDQARALIGR